MGGPQTQDGFMRLANELLDAIAASDFSKREYKVILAVMRQTYGYNRKTAPICVKALAAATGLDERHVRRTVADLVDASVILRVGGEIGIQKNYSNWAGQNSPETRAKTAPPCGPKQPARQVWIRPMAPIPGSLNTILKT